MLISASTIAPRRYNKELQTSLAYRATTKTAMVQGMGGFINTNALTVPEPADMGFVMRNGRLTRIDRPRINGPAHFWQTSSERAVRYHSDPQTLEL